jgi:hypothetical protein
MGKANQITFQNDMFSWLAPEPLINSLTNISVKNHYEYIS